jgi:NAD(P)H-dependent FMN reductase
MKQILIVDVSPRGLESASRKVARKLEERLKVEYPSAEIVHRDLVVDSLPHLDRVTLKAISTKDAAEAERLKPSASLSDKLTDELLASALLVIATPTWNFGIPSALKAWIDLWFARLDLQIYGWWRVGTRWRQTGDSGIGLRRSVHRRPVEVMGLRGTLFAQNFRLHWN